MAKKTLCLKCEFARWHKTPASRLHPDGQGKCTYQPPHVPTPAVRYWVGHGCDSLGLPPRLANTSMNRNGVIVTECETFKEAT